MGELQRLEQQVDKIIDRSKILDVVEDDNITQRAVGDVAQHIKEYDEIASRYSLSTDELIQFVQNPQIHKRIKSRRAVWESDDNVDGRIRKLSGVTLLEALPSIGAFLFDPKLPAATRADFVKLFMRMAGVDGLPQQGKDGSAMSGNQFSVTINLGEKVEKFTTVVDARAETIPEPSGE